QDIAADGKVPKQAIGNEGTCDNAGKDIEQPTADMAETVSHIATIDKAGGGYAVIIFHVFYQNRQVFWAMVEVAIHHYNDVAGRMFDAVPNGQCQAGIAGTKQGLYIG